MSNSLPPSRLRRPPSGGVHSKKWLERLPTSPTANNDEIMNYLRFLLKHQTNCELQTCSLCHTLMRICEMVGHHIFSATLFGVDIHTGTKGAIVLPAILVDGVLERLHGSPEFASAAIERQ